MDIPSGREYFGTKPNSFFAISASRLILCTSPILGGTYSGFISRPNTFEKISISSFTDVSKIIILHSYLIRGRMRILSSLATRSLKKYGNRIKCHAELVSASDKINKSRDPEINSG